MSDSESQESGPETAAEEEKPLKSGFLTKVGGRKKTWKRRWFVLTATSLKYYKSEKITKPQGSIYLRQVRTLRLTEDVRTTPTKFAFEMETPERTYIFCAGSEADLQSWMAVCQQNLPRTTTTTADIVKSGYLTKQGGNIKSWKRRYFVLRNDNLLSYYQDEKDSSNLGIIDLERCTSINLAPKIHKDFAFEISVPGRTYLMYASSKEEMDSWLHAMLKIVGSALDEAPIDDDEERPSESDLKLFLQSSDLQSSKEGFLTKQGAKVKSWKKRWFVLRAATLAYYRDKGDSSPIGLIPLESCQRIDLASKKESRPNTFEAVTEKRVYVFQATSQDEMWDWINCLSDALTKLDSGSTRTEILALKRAAELAKTKKALRTRVVRQKTLKRLLKAKQKNMPAEEEQRRLSKGSGKWTQEATSRQRQLSGMRAAAKAAGSSLPAAHPEEAPVELKEEIQTMEKEIEKLNSMLTSVQPSTYARAIMDYEPNAYDESALRFKSGQILIVEEKDGSGQCVGRLVDLMTSSLHLEDSGGERRGTFPSRYIEEMDDAEFEMIRGSTDTGSSSNSSESWDNELEDAAKSLFGMYDSDGDGFVTLVDFYEFLYEFGKTYLTDEQVQKCWQVLDVDGTSLVNQANFRKGIQALDDVDFYSNWNE